MTSSRLPVTASRRATDSSAIISSSTSTAFARSSPLSNSGTMSSTGGAAGQARSASSCTAARSAADVVKLTTYRWQASTPCRRWIAAIAVKVASTSRVGADKAPPARSSRSAAACTALCWRTSSPAR